MKISFLSGFLILAAACSLSPAQAQKAEYQENALYVRFRQTASPKMAADTRILPVSKVKALEKHQKAYGVHQELFSMRTFNHPVLERTFELRLDSTQKIEQLVKALQKESDIELVERIPVYYLQGEMMPAETLDETEEADPFYTKNNPSSNTSWHLDMIHAEDAWEMQTGSEKIKVAVVDNAIWGAHPDLQISPENQYNTAMRTVGNSAPPASVRQDVECVSISTNTSCPELNWSHGTHTAGAVGAIRNNGVGIASIGSGVTLMGVSCPGTDASGLAMGNGFTGVSWAAEHGAKVISLSWGKTSITETDRAIIQTCIDKGIIIVAAAGNNNSPQIFYPANLPGVISVASVDNNRQISSFSNYGDWVNIAAPGGKIIQNDKETQACIFSTTYCVSQRYRLAKFAFANGTYYDGMFGTSMATPIVSGLCGLLLSADSTIDPYLMREILVNTAQPIALSAGKNIAANSGIIDAAAALRRLKDVKIPRVRNLKAERTDLDVVLSWEKPQGENEVESYQVFLNNVFIGQVSNEELSFTHHITNPVESLNHYGVQVLYANKDTSLRAATDLRVPNLYEIKTEVEPAGCGTVTGAGIYQNETIHLTAQVAEGCKFSRWMEESSVLGRNAEIDYTVKRNATIRAIFTGEPVGNSVFDQNKVVNVYPNPTSGRFVVEMETEDNLVEIFSAEGVQVARHEHVGTSLELNLYESGTYLIRVSNRHGNTVRKIIVR